MVVSASRKDLLTVNLTATLIDEREFCFRVALKERARGFIGNKNKFAKTVHPLRLLGK